MNLEYYHECMSIQKIIIKKEPFWRLSRYSYYMDLELCIMEMINNMIHDFKVNVSFLSKLVEGLNFSLIIPYVTYHLKIITIMILKYFKY